MDVLNDVIGLPSEKDVVTQRSLKRDWGPEKPSEVEAAIDFGGLGLHVFAEAHQEKNYDSQSIGRINHAQSVDDCP